MRVNDMIIDWAHHNGMKSSALGYVGSSFTVCRIVLEGSRASLLRLSPVKTQAEADIVRDAYIVEGCLAVVAVKLNPREQFNKNKARKYSLARAMKSAEFPKSVRKVVWEEYDCMIGLAGSGPLK